MPAAKYEDIYQGLRADIEAGVYPKELPPEHTLSEQYGCSRNTVRRATARLAEEGYVQSVHGRGVFVLHQRPEQTEFMICGVESMKEAAARNHLQVRTKLIYFTELVVDEALRDLTGFPEGAEIYCLRRVRYLDGTALIVDHNYFLKSVVRGLTPTIAEASVYDYMENVLKETIVTTQRKFTVDLATDLDREYLDLGAYNSLVVVSGRTFNADGIQFEYTQSRHRPDRFVFYGQVRRMKPGR